MAVRVRADIHQRISLQTLILMCDWHQIDRCQNNKYADQDLSLDRGLWLFSATDFDVINFDVESRNKMIAPLRYLNCSLRLLALRTRFGTLSVSCARH